MGDQIKLKRLTKPQGILAIALVILSLTGSILLWSSSSLLTTVREYLQVSDAAIALVFIISVVGLVAFLIKRPLIFAWTFGVAVFISPDWGFWADVSRRINNNQFLTSDSLTKVVVGFSLHLIAMFLGFLIVRSKFKKFKKPIKIIGFLTVIFNIIGCALLWAGYESSFDQFDWFSLIVFALLQKIMNWGILFFLIGMFFLVSLLVKWKPAIPITLYLGGIAVTQLQYYDILNKFDNQLFGNKNSKAGLIIVCIAGLLMFLYIVLTKTSRKRFHPHKLLKRLKTWQFVVLLLAFLFALIGASLYWSKSQNTTTEKYDLSLLFLIVFLNFLGFMIKQPLIFVASVSATFELIYSFLLPETKSAFHSDNIPGKIKTSLILLWIGVGLSYFVVPLKKRKHLDWNSLRVLIGLVISIAFVVLGIVISTSDYLGPGLFVIAPYFMAILFTVAWATKLDEFQVISVFASGRFVYDYLGLYHLFKSLDTKIEACSIVLIILMCLSMIYLNVPMLSKYKKKKKKKSKRGEEAPLRG